MLPALALLIAIVVGTGFVRWGVGKGLKSAAATRPHTNMTGAEVAQLLLEEAGPTGASVVKFDAAVSDRWDPKKRRVLLTKKAFLGKTADAWGIAAHETGHALQQHAKANGWRSRLTVLKLGGFVAGISPYLLAGLTIFRGIPTFRVSIFIVLAIWTVYGLALLLTAATEHNATSRAIKALQRCGHLQRQEEEDAVRTAAAAIAWRELGLIPQSPLHFLYQLVPLLGRPKE